ncbi:hypothetical protein CDD83_9930 [Cordyceps sp. RAO-2017]|nr:hypothetical protein CDD83_9930 [Cordyceps sp. RAO-2017]
MQIPARLLAESSHPSPSRVGRFCFRFLSLSLSPSLPVSSYPPFPRSGQWKRCPGTQFDLATPPSPLNKDASTVDEPGLMTAGRPDEAWHSRRPDPDAFGSTGSSSLAARPMGTARWTAARRVLSSPAAVARRLRAATSLGFLSSPETEPRSIPDRQPSSRTDSQAATPLEPAAAWRVPLGGARKRRWVVCGNGRPGVLQLLYRKSPDPGLLSPSAPPSPSQ